MLDFNIGDFQWERSAKPDKEASLRPLFRQKLIAKIRQWAQMSKIGAMNKGGSRANWNLRRPG